MATGKTKKEAAEEVAPSKEVAVAEWHKNAQLMSAVQKVANKFTTVSALEQELGSLIAWDVISPSYDVTSKLELEGMPLILMAWRFTESKKYQTRNAEGNLIPAWFVSVLYAPYDDDGNLGKLAIFNDGSTGIYNQLEQVTQEFGVYGGVKCAKGLRVSEYDYEAPDGSVSQAHTWYLA